MSAEAGEEAGSTAGAEADPCDGEAEADGATGGRSPLPADRSATPSGGPPAPGDGSAAEGTYGQTWTYESIVGAIPGVDVPDRIALAIQFVLFEGAALVLAEIYGLWASVPAATAAILVATAGSALMLDLGRRLRATDLPAAYTHVVFGSSVETVLGVVAYVAFLTYLLTIDANGGLLTKLLGRAPPAPATFLALLVCWDVCYRIGVGWWAAVTAAWRSFAFDLDPAARRAMRAAERRNAAFGVLQAVLVPFLLGTPVLAVAVLGHVFAVLIALGVAAVKD